LLIYSRTNHSRVVVNNSMILKRFILIFLISILLTSCYDSFSSKELRANFTDAQIKDLESSTIFFKSQICKDENLNFKDCYNSFLPDLFENGIQSIIKNIDFNDQMNTYNRFESNVFNEIWEFCETREKEKNYKSVCSKFDGKYQNFIKDLSVKHPFLKKYYNDLIQSGDFDYSFYLEEMLYKNSDVIDFNDPNIMTLISIHFLTQNDDYNRK